jgi:hypothetical protein
VTFDENSTGRGMVKNVKIDDETHRRVSIKAAELQVLKSDLCSCLIRAALLEFGTEKIRNLILEYHPDEPAKKP